MSNIKVITASHIKRSILRALTGVQNVNPVQRRTLKLWAELAGRADSPVAKAPPSAPHELIVFNHHIYIPMGLHWEGMSNMKLNGINMPKTWQSVKWLSTINGGTKTASEHQRPIGCPWVLCSVQQSSSFYGVTFIALTSRQENREISPEGALICRIPFTSENDSQTNLCRARQCFWYLTINTDFSVISIVCIYWLKTL